MLFREVNLNLARDALNNKEFDESRRFVAKARTWPENLGVGRPYDVDERIEDYLLARSFELEGNRQEAKRYLKKILDYKENVPSSRLTSGALIALAALVDMGEKPKARDRIHQWVRSRPEDLAVQWSAYWLEDITDEAEALLKYNSSSSDNSSEDPFLFWVQDYLLSL
jgi:hypothetical protein